MADLPNTPLTKINDIEVTNDAPVTEDLLRKIGIDINALIDRQGVTYEEFFANGTFVVPANVNHVWVLGCGGGGGGATTSSSPYGGAGGGGAVPTLLHTLVTPSASIAVTIGAGGAGGTAFSVTNGSPGSNTTFGTLLTFGGARGGVHGNGQPATGGNQLNLSTISDSLLTKTGLYTGRGYFTYGGTGPDSLGTYPSSAGESSFYAAGGAHSGAGGGGGAGFGAGGAGATSFLATASSGGYGAGGGGSGSGASGAGGGGYLRVIYANS